MPTYKVTDPQSGKALELTGDSPPTEEELNEIFGTLKIGGTYQPVPYSEDRPSGISTITGKPIKSYVPGEEPGASLGTLFKTTFVDDPKRQIQIYAEARGIPVSRYRIHNGEIIFRNKAGKWQRETGELPVSLLKRAAAKSASPPVIGATIGAILGGPMVAAAGAGFGELVRQGIGAGLHGDFGADTTVAGVPVSVSNIGDIIWESSMALASELPAVSVKAMVLGSRMRKSGLKPGAPVLRIANLTPKDHLKAEIVKNIAEQHGIDLPLHQAYDKASLENFWMYLRKHPATSDRIKEVESKLAEQGDEAIKRFVEPLRHGKIESSAELGEQAKEAATSVIGKAKEYRWSEVSPMYDEAVREAQLSGGIDLEPAIKQLDQLISSWPNGPNKKLLQSVKKSLGEEEKVTERKQGELPKTIFTSEKDLSKIQKALWQINDIIEGKGVEVAKISPSTSTQFTRDLLSLKTQMLDLIGKKAPTFLEANERFASLSPPVDSLVKSVVGAVSRLQTDKTTADASKLLLNVNHPELVRRARNSLQPQDPELWDKLVGDYISDTYHSVRLNVRDPLLQFGEFRRKLFDTSDKQKIMYEALGPQKFNVFNDLMMVLNRMTAGTKGQSMTAQYQEMGRALSPMSGSAVYQLGTNTRRALVESLIGTYNDVLIMGRHMQMLDAMLAPEAIKKLAKLKPLTPGSRKLIDGVSEYLGMVAPVGEALNYGNRMPGEQ